jgi:hypothetical protein
MVFECLSLQSAGPQEQWIGNLLLSPITRIFRRITLGP